MKSSLYCDNCENPIGIGHRYIVTKLPKTKEVAFVDGNVYLCAGCFVEDVHNEA